MVTKKTCIALSGISLAFMVLACSISNAPSQSEEPVGTQVDQTLTTIVSEGDEKAAGQLDSETPAPDPDSASTFLYLQNEVLYGFDLDWMTSHLITLEIQEGGPRRQLAVLMEGTWHTWMKVD